MDSFKTSLAANDRRLEVQYSNEILTDWLSVYIHILNANCSKCLDHS